MRERTAELERAVKELETFSYSVSHDLRAPLRTINGYSRILLDEFAAELPEGALRKLENIREVARQMGQLIDDILEFSRLSRHTLTRRAVNMQALAAETFEALMTGQPTRQVQFQMQPLPEAFADLTLMRQVFSNLLDNALKYSRQRQPAIIECGFTELDGQTVYYVRDNGAGFDMRYADKLFGVFQRLHRAEEFEGTGIGLANVKRILERHGGRIWAESQLEQGSTFYFTIPA